MCAGRFSESIYGTYFASLSSLGNQSRSGYIFQPTKCGVHIGESGMCRMSGWINWWMVGDVSGEVAGEEASSRDLMFGWRRDFVAHWADRISMRACIVIRANAGLNCVLFLSKTLYLSCFRSASLELRMCVCGLLTLRPAGLTAAGWLIMQIGCRGAAGPRGRGDGLWCSFWPRDGMMCATDGQ